MYSFVQSLLLESFFLVQLSREDGRLSAVAAFEVEIEIELHIEIFNIVTM